MATKQLSVVIQAVDQMSGPTTRATNAAAQGILRIAAAGEKASAATFKMDLGLGKVLGLLTGLAAAAGGVIALNRIVESVRSTGDELDRLGKLSRRLDIPVEDLSALKFAADVTGAGFENLASGIETARKNIVQFVRFGDGKAADVLKNLRTPLTGGDGEIRPIASLLPDLLDEIREFEKGDQALVVRKIFGDESALLFIQQGARGLRELTAEAQKFGGIFTKADTDAAERLNDSIQRIQTSLKALKAQVLVEIEPALVQAFDGLAAGLAQGRPFIRGAGQIVKDLFDADVQVQQEAADRLRRIIDAVGEIAGPAIAATGNIAAELFVDGFMLVFGTLGDRIRDSINDQVLELRSSIKSDPVLAVLIGAVPQFKALNALDDAIVGDKIKRSARGRLEDARQELDNEIARIAERKRDLGGKIAGVAVDEIAAGDAGLLKPFRDNIAAIEAELNASVLGDNTRLAARASRLVADFKANFGALGQLTGGPRASIADALLESVTGRGAINAERDAAFAKVDAFLSGGSLVEGTRQLAKETENLVGPTRDAVKEYQKFLDVLKAFDLEAREAETLGRDREAARIRLVNSIEAERQKLLELGEAADGVREQFERVSLVRLRRFDVDTDALAITQALTEAEETYRRGLAERAQLVEAGTLQEFQATQQNLQAADTLKKVGAESLAQIDAIIARNQDLAPVLEETRRKIEGIIAAAGGVRGGGNVGSFGGGVERGFDRLIEKARDFQGQGESLSQTVGDSLVSNISGALFDVSQDFKSTEKIAKQAFGNIARAAAQAALQILVLRAISGIAGAFAGGGGSGTPGSSNFVGPLTPNQFAAGGIVTPPGIRRGYAAGGLVPAGEDTIVGVRFGEGILRQQAMQSIGIPKFHELNRRGAAALGSGGGGVVINMPVTINGGDPRAVQAQLDQIPRRIVDALRQSPAYRGDMRSAMEGG